MFILSHPPGATPNRVIPRGHSFDRAAKRSNNLLSARAAAPSRRRPRIPSLSPTMPINNPEAADKNAITAKSGRCQVLAGTGSPQPREGRANG